MNLVNLFDVSFASGVVNHAAIIKLGSNERSIDGKKRVTIHATSFAADNFEQIDTSIAGDFQIIDVRY